MKLTSFSVTAILISSWLVLSGCNKSEASSSTSSAGSASAKPASTQPAPTPVAEPAANLPDKGPWEAIKITYLDKRDPKDNSPLFKLENLGGKTVVVAFIDFYGYDAKGKQVAKKELSWNGELTGGKSDEVYTSDVKEATTWEATYHGIEFKGDASPTMDYKRAPANRAKGGS